MNEIVFEKKGLSLERLHLLCKVATSGGIRMAVGEDPVRQSLASRQLKELRDYVGTDLCHRNGRTLEMTPAGKELASIGNDFFRKLETFLRSINNLPVHFELGVGDSIFQWQILPHMRDFQNKFPTIQLQSFSYSAKEIIRKVENQTFDAGIVRKTAIGQTNLIAFDAGTIKYKLFIPSSFLGKNLQGIPSINAIPFCTLTGDGEFAKAMVTFLATFNGTPALNCSSMTQMYAAVQSGQYAAILPSAAETGLPKNIATAFTLPELTPFSRQIAIIYKPETMVDSRKKKVVEFLCSTFAKEV